MNKLKFLLLSPQFWSWFVGITLGIFALETFFLGLWVLPIINYGISYMGEVTSLDLAFTVIFALLFGFGTALFVLVKKFNTVSCTIGVSSGLIGFFTLLCPICPIFFLAYFGLSASVMTIAPYFLWFRLTALALLLIGIVILWRHFKPSRSFIFNGYAVFQKVAITLITILFLGNQTLAIQIGQNMLGPQPGERVVLLGDFSRDVAALVAPASLPFYGPELGLDFSSLQKINTSIKKLGIMAPKQGSNPIELTKIEMERYVAIGTVSTVACEFCCSAKTLVREDGSPTCSCAHSKAMRGTAGYLLRNYPEMTNDEISYELIRLKGLFFPKQMQKRMASELAGDPADFTPDIRYLTQNLSAPELKRLQTAAKESGFEPSTQGPDMVGGC